MRNAILKSDGFPVLDSAQIMQLMWMEPNGPGDVDVPVAFHMRVLFSLVVYFAEVVKPILHIAICESQVGGMRCRREASNHCRCETYPISSKI